MFSYVAVTTEYKRLAFIMSSVRSCRISLKKKNPHDIVITTSFAQNITNEIHM